MDKQSVVLHSPTWEYPCRVPNCASKKRNGRCSLNKIIFKVVDGQVDHSQCLNWSKKC